MKRMSTLIAAGVLVVAGGLILRAQQQDAPTFKLVTQVVSLFATVTDGQNRLVPDLSREDFEVFDNDKPQEILVFDNEVQPITVVVMLDTSASMTNSIDLLKLASEQFLLRLLPEDKAAVGAFNDKIEMSAAFTSNRDQLISEVRDFDYGNSTRLWDAVGEGLEMLKGIEGRRVVLVFTDGEDFGSRISRNAVLDRARADEVMIYSIGLEGVVMGQRSKPDGGLKRLSDETGGGYFELRRTADLGPTFSRIALELHSQYVLGFEAKQLDGKVHKLSIKLKEPGMNARARKSYVASAAAPPPSR